MELNKELREYAFKLQKVPKPFIRFVGGKWRATLGKKSTAGPYYFFGSYDSKTAAEAAVNKAYQERLKVFNEAREGFLNPKQTTEFLKDKGINIGKATMPRTLKKAGFETVGGSKGAETLYKTPTEEQVNRLKENLLKDPKSELFKASAKTKSKLIEKLIRQGKNKTEIIEQAKVTGTTIDAIAKDKNLKITSGREADGSKVVQNIKTQLRTLDSELKNVIRAGNYTFDGLVSRARKILNLPNNASGTASAAYRIGQLIEAYRGDSQYINRTSPLLAKQSIKFLKGLPEAKGYGGLRAVLRRRSLESNVTKQLGERKTFFANVRKRLQELIPSDKINIDEVKNVASSGRYGTGPYSIFIQGIKENINEAKGKTVDRLIGDVEFKLQNLDPIENAYIDPKTNKAETKEQIIKNYNKKAEIYRKQFNKNLKSGELPVRVPKLSDQSPKKSIQNKEAYNKFKDIFDDIHTKFGYSFEVPSDLKTVYEARDYLKSDLGQRRLSRFLKSGAGRVLGLPFVAIGGAYLASKTATPVMASEAQPGDLQAANREQQIEAQYQIPSLRFDEYDTSTYPSNPEVKSQLANIALTTGLVTGLTKAPEGYKEARALGRGRVRSTIGLGGGLGRTLAVTGTPLFAGGFEIARAIDKLKEGQSISEILAPRLSEEEKEKFFKEETGLGEKVMTAGMNIIDSPAFGVSLMEPLTKASGAAKPGLFNKILRAGLSPRTIAGATRFLGLPGLAISTGLTAYDLYNTYKQSKKSQGIDE